MHQSSFGSWAASQSFRRNAAGARRLAGTFRHPDTVDDLQKYAAALERDASDLEPSLPGRALASRS
jgi:hypothetical protein